MSGMWASVPLVPAIALAAATAFVAPLWPWSRGWGWSPFGMLAMGLGGLVLFSLTIVPA